MLAPDPLRQPLLLHLGCLADGASGDRDVAAWKRDSLSNETPLLHQSHLLVQGQYRANFQRT